MKVLVVFRLVGCSGWFLILIGWLFMVLISMLWVWLLCMKVLV